MDLYFRVIPKSPVMAKIDECKERMAAHSKARIAFMKRHGFSKAARSYGYEWSMIGVAEKTDRPGWRWKAAERYSVPALKTPEGKAIKAELKALPPGVEWREVSDALFKHGFVSSHNDRGMCTRWAVFAWNKNGVVCCMHADVKRAAKKWPEGLVEITGSEAAKLNGSTKEEK